jgi:hypothetical protein
MRYGTCYFITKAHAFRYYARQGFDAAAVKQKINTEGIIIGVPPRKACERAYTDSDGRYWIDDTGSSGPGFPPLKEPTT